MQAGIVLEKLGRRKKILAGLGLLAVVALVAGLNLARGREGARIPVQAARAEMKEIQDSVFATGRVRLVEKQDVYAENAATVQKILVRPGDRVQKGQLLIVLDDGDFEAGLKEARADLTARESGAIAGNEIKSLEAQLNAARAQYEKAEKQYNRANVKAGMDGTVFTVEVAEGDAVAARTRLLTVGNPDRLEITASISEVDSSRLKTGQRVEVKVAAAPEGKYSGTLARELNRSGAIFLVKIDKLLQLFHGQLIVNRPDR